MAGLADLFGMGDGSGMFGGGAGMYADLLTPEMKQQMAFRGLMAAAGALGQAAMPSRMPVPIGAALGSAAGAMADAQDKGLESALKALLTGGKLQEMRSNIDIDKAIMGNMANQPPMYATPSGAPQPLVPSAVAPGADTLGTGGAPKAVSTMTADATMDPVQRAFLDSIAGPESDGVYNVRYTPRGGVTFASYDAHPNIPEPGPQGPSTASGRYQIVNSTWRPLQEKLGLSDFKPVSQDRAAWTLAADTYQKQTGRDLLGDLKAGKLDQIPSALSGQWPTIRKALPSFAANLAKYGAAGTAITDEGVALPAVPDFSGMMAGNQGPGYAPAAALPAQDTVVASGAPVAPRGGRIGAIGEGVNARLVNMDTGEPISPSMPPAAQSITAQIPAALPASAPPPVTPFGNISPDYIKWAQLQSQLLTRHKYPVPAYIAEAAALPLKYAEPAANVGLQEQLAAAKARGELPSSMTLAQYKAVVDRETERQRQGLTMGASGAIEEIPDYGRVVAGIKGATAAAEEAAKAEQDIVTVPRVDPATGLMTNIRMSRAALAQQLAQQQQQQRQQPQPQVAPVAPVQGATPPIGAEPAGVGTVPPGQQMVVGPDGRPRYENVPGSPQAEAKAEREKGQAQSINVVTQDIDRALGLSGYFTTGPAGAVLQGVPGTSAHDLQQILMGLRANTGFAELNKMRAQSPSGGALGPVSDNENKLLQSTLGSLEQSQSKGQFELNLRRLHNIYLDIVNGSSAQLNDAVKAGKLSSAQRDAVLAIPRYELPAIPARPGPATETKPSANALRSEAADAIAKGAPRDAVIKRLQSMGIDPSGL